MAQQGLSPNQGQSPFAILEMNGEAEPRLTSGGEAATKHALDSIHKRMNLLGTRSGCSDRLVQLLVGCALGVDYEGSRLLAESAD